MVTEHASKQVLLSQFPSPSAHKGKNFTKDYLTTFADEKRHPDSIWKVHVPNDAAFDAEVAKQKGITTWDWDPGEDETQCSTSAARALEAGGVSLTAITKGTLMPNFFDNNLIKNQHVHGNDIQQLANSAAAAKGYDSVAVNSNGTVTGTYTSLGSRIPHSVTCDGEGHCSGN